MTQRQTASEILADWRYTPDEWLRFVEYEKQMRGGKIAVTLLKIIFGVGVALSFLTIGGAIISPDFFMDLEGGLGAMIIIFLVVTAFLLVVSGIYWLVKRSELSTLGSRPGETRISLHDVIVNGLRFDWEFDGNRSRFISLTRQTVQTATGEINLLEFKCHVKIKVRGNYQTFDKLWRVPIPRGREREADSAIQRIYEARANFLQSQNPSPSAPLGLLANTAANEHDFAGSAVCLKCGASIEAITYFKWKCKK